MDVVEHERYVRWVETNPLIPAGKTHLQVWNEKMRGDLRGWLDD